MSEPSTHRLRASPDDPVMPASYVQQLVGLVSRWQVSADALLAGTGVSPEELAKPLGRVTPRQYTTLITRARVLTGEPGLALWWGRQMRLSWHGPLGFAVLSSRTLREALDVAERFLPARVPEMSLAWRQKGREVEIVIDECFTSAVAAEYSVIALFVFFARVVEELLGETPQSRAGFAFPEPAWATGLRDALATELSFGGRINRVMFPAHYLDRPLAGADVAAQQRACEECEREMASVIAASGCSGRVRALVLDWPDGMPAQADIAAVLGMSSRSLSRRLAAEGTGFRQLVDDVLCARATEMLEAPDARVERIAEALGYSDAANFTRAFRRWSGVSPRRYRTERRR